MRLKDILFILDDIHRKNDGVSKPYICGGIARDRVLNNIPEQITDLDITNGDESINTLADLFHKNLSSKYNVKFKKNSDGHVTIHAGNLKIDFSSNFVTPGISNILNKMGVVDSSDLTKETYSRDFTCNSLLLDFSLRNVKDLTGKGIVDINEKVIKTCLPPEITLKFSNKRILRVIYLATKLGFKVDEEIITYIKNINYILDIPKDVQLKVLDTALSYNTPKTINLITKMNLWEKIEISNKLKPYYVNKLSMNPTFYKNYDYVNLK